MVDIAYVCNVYSFQILLRTTINKTEMAKKMANKSDIQVNYLRSGVNSTQYFISMVNDLIIVAMKKIQMKNDRSHIYIRLESGVMHVTFVCESVCLFTILSFSSLNIRLALFILFSLLLFHDVTICSIGFII